MTRLFSIQQTKSAFLILFCVIFCASCTTIQNPLTGNSRVGGFSWEQGVQIGQEADAQIIAQYGLYDDPALSAYVTRIGEAVLAQSHLRRETATSAQRNTPFTFRILDSPIVNAFALPGGFIYVTRGLLAHLENEAQLAVVLGHEVVHVVAQHSSQSAGRAQLGQLGLIGGIIAGSAAGVNDQILGTAAQAANTGIQLLFLKYGRGAETESDKFGVEYAALAGYEVGEAARFFQSLKRINDQSGQSIPSFMSTHPDPGQREQNILAMAAEWERQAPTDIIDQDEFYQHIDGIIAGENPRQGFVEEGMFYHPDLQFEFPVPANWALANGAAQVQMVSNQQDAAIVFQLAGQANSAQEAATAFGNQEGFVLRNHQAAQVRGLRAYWVLGEVAQQNGATVGVLTYFIEYNGQVYQFLSYTASTQFANYERTFLQTMLGFGPLSNNAALHVQPVRLSIQRINRSGAFQSFLGPLPRGMSAEAAAILNQVSLGQNISSGTRLKLFR